MQLHIFFLTYRYLAFAFAIMAQIELMAASTNERIRSDEIYRKSFSIAPGKTFTFVVEKVLREATESERKEIAELTAEWRKALRQIEPDLYDDKPSPLEIANKLFISTLRYEIQIGQETRHLLDVIDAIEPTPEQIGGSHAVLGCGFAGDRIFVLDFDFITKCVHLFVFDNVFAVKREEGVRRVLVFNTGELSQYKLPFKGEVVVDANTNKVQVKMFDGTRLIHDATIDVITGQPMQPPQKRGPTGNDT